MDRDNLLTVIEQGLRSEIPDLKLHVLEADLPTNVEVLVISSLFHGMPRRKRMELLTSRVEAYSESNFTRVYTSHPA